MKIKLPTALRAAVLSAMAVTVCTAYALPYDPNATTDPIQSIVSGLLVGDNTGATFSPSLGNLTVTGDMVAGAGDRNGISGGDGTIELNNATVHVGGNIYAGASGINSFSGYVTNANGGNGTISFQNSDLSVAGAVRLGWLSGKTGAMSLNGSTATVGGQIVLGYYNKQGSDSLGTRGQLTLENGASMTAMREVFVASGSLNLSGKNTSIRGLSNLEIVGKAASGVTLADFADAHFNSILIGSHGESATLTLTGEATLTAGNNLQLSAGSIQVTSSKLVVNGDAWLGNQLPGASSTIDSNMSLSGAKASFTSNTLSIWSDAEISIDQSAGLVTSTLQSSGTISLQGSGTMKVDSFNLLEGSSTSIDNGTLAAGSTQVFGKSVLTILNTGKDDISLGNTLIDGGYLLLQGENSAAGMDHLDVTNGTIESALSLHIENAVVDRGSAINVTSQGNVEIAHNLELHGSASIAGALQTTSLLLDGTSRISVTGAGKLTAHDTAITNKVVLDNTGLNKGTLGGISFADNAVLELGNGNTAGSIQTGKNNTVTVTGSGNSLGNVTIGSDSNFSERGTNEAASLVNNGTSDIAGALTVTGSTLTLGTGSLTTVSGSLTATQVTWDPTNAQVTLLVNANTQSGSTMLTVGSGLTGGDLNVAVDMNKGISGLSGKSVSFAANGSDLVEFTKTDDNFKILADGTTEQVNDQGNHIAIRHTIGSSTTYYGYTVNSGTITADGWKGTGITFDSGYSNSFEGKKDETGSKIIIETVQTGTTTVTDSSGTHYAKVDLTGEGHEGSTIICQDITLNGDTGNPLTVGSQVVKLDDQNSDNKPIIIATGTKTWEVTDETTVQGAGKDSSLIGGLQGSITDNNGDTIQTDKIGSLNIASGKTLTVESTSVTIDHTLSMGEGATIAAKDSSIVIGGEQLVLDKDVAFEVPKYDADGKLVKDSAGNPVMETVNLSTELEQHAINNISLNLEDSTFKVEQFEVYDNKQSATVNTSNGVVFNNATVITKQTEGNTMELGSSTAQMVFNNSTIAGTGTLTNVVMNGGTLQIGNSPGMRSIDGGNYNGVSLNFMIDPTQTLSGTLNTDSDKTLSQLNVIGSSSLTNVVLNIYMQSQNGLGDYVTIPNTSREYIDTFTEGTSFQLITGVENLEAGNLTIGSLPTLQDGLVWDTSSLFTDGTIKVGKGTYSDPARIANTLVSAGETVSGFGQMTRSHIYDVRLNGTNVWVNGLGTFLNHSSHNGRTGFEYNAGGYALGADTIVDNKAVVGVAIGQSFGKQTPKAGSRFYDAGKIDMNSVMVGLYGGTSFNMKSPSDSMKLDAYASYGRFDNDSTHHSLMGNNAATASWKENAYALGATLTRVHEVRENLYFSPFASLDYTYADLDSVNESSPNGNIHYESTAYQNLSLSLGTGLTRVYHLHGGQELSPYVSVAYVGDLIRKDAKVTSRNATGSLSERSVSPGRNAFQVNVGSGWKVSQQWGVRVGYTAEFRSGATDQGVNVGVSYAF